MNPTTDTEPVQRMTLYFPLPLLDKVRKSAKQHKRSFNQQALWMIEQELMKETPAQQAQ